MHLPIPIIFQFTRRLSNISYIHKFGPDPLLSITGGQLVESAARKYPQRTAIISCHQNKQLTFAQLLQQVDNFAVGLRKLNVHKGDALAVWGPNSIEWIITSLACARLGVVLVQLNHSYKKNELLYSLNKTNAKALVCGHVSARQHYYDIIKEVDKDIFKNGTDLHSKMLPSIQSVIMMDDNRTFAGAGTYHFDELSKNHSEEELKWVMDNQNVTQFDDPINIQFTSGSTGNPKAAILSHHNIINNSYCLGRRLKLHEQHHKICVQVPLFHAYGTTGGIFTGLHFGATLVMPTDFYNPTKALQSIQDHKCSIIYGTPTMHIDLIKEQKKHKLDIHPSVVCTGGGPSTPKLIADVYKYLGCQVVNFYGLTETTAMNFQSYLNADMDHVANSVGHIANHVEAKIIDENGNIVPFGIPGELCVRGYMNMLEYLGDPKQTASLIGPDRWLKTGDKFILYEDGTGKIIGRIKEIIIRGGENIHPKEIEDCLSQHPKIIDCQIVGIPHERLGEEVCACVRLKPGEQITLEEVVDFCKRHMAHYKLPSKLYALDDYPKTTSGKIQKFKIVEMLKEHYKL